MRAQWRKGSTIIAPVSGVSMPRGMPWEREPILESGGVAPSGVHGDKAPRHPPGISCQYFANKETIFMLFRKLNFTTLSISSNI